MTGIGTKYLSIVISGTPVSGKSTLAKELSKQYSWPIHSLGGLWRARYAELHPNKDITFEEFWSKTTLEENKEMNVQAKVLFEKGGVIGESRYVSYLDTSKCLLVFVAADIGIRVERSQERDEYKGKAADEIRSILERREADELRLGQSIFGMDYRNHLGYHLVLNSGKMTVKQEIEAVNALMRK
jgi:cytidylate kinase